MKYQGWLALVVIACATLVVAAFIVPCFLGSSPDEPTSVIESIIGMNGVIPITLEMFKQDIGAYPKELRKLVEAPSADDKERANWQGPYLKNAQELKDPWGNPIEYHYPGVKNPDSYDLWSLGPDGKNGTEDDITHCQ